jgi:hypothetical protein
MPARLLLAVTVAIVLLTGCGTGTTYNETAHRAAVEATAGRAVHDWPAYLEVARRACDMDDDTFGFYLATAMDQGMADQVMVDVRYLCPDRMEDVAALQRDLDRVEQACANPVTREDRLLAEAMRESGGC